MMGSELPEETTVMTCSSTARPSSLSTLPQSLSSTWGQSPMIVTVLWHFLTHWACGVTLQQKVATLGRQYLITKFAVYASPSTEAQQKFFELPSSPHTGVAGLQHYLAIRLLVFTWKHVFLHQNSPTKLACMMKTDISPRYATKEDSLGSIPTWHTP